MAIRLPEAHLHLLELPPNGKAAPAFPLKGQYSRWTVPLLGSKDGGWGWGKALPQGPGDRRELSPQGKMGVSAEERILALEEAKQSAVWNRLLDDLLDL